MTTLIIGGGASGMLAALCAARHTQVMLLERQNRLGRKLLSTGNGRCNLTNLDLSFDHYHGGHAEFCHPALDAFGTAETLVFFRSLGLLTVCQEDGRIYPASDSANSVLDVLRLHLEQNENVTIQTGCEIRAISRRKGCFLAQSDLGEFSGDRVIICAGGAAGAKLGGTELGYRLLASFGHRCTALYPALVQLKTTPDYVRALKGVRCRARVRFGTQEREGELQFTDYGVSGPVIFELSRAASVAGRGMLTIDLLPNVQPDELYVLLAARCAALPQLSAQELLTGMLHNRLGKTVLRMCGVPAELPCGETDALDRICRMVKHWELPVLGTMGMEAAQVTAGGIRTDEFDPFTLQSRLCPGLYAAGEVLDVDGDCGGYNLQWAWSSGYLAGQLKGTP